jgi:hypothetical protein
MTYNNKDIESISDNEQSTEVDSDGEKSEVSGNYEGQNTPIDLSKNEIYRGMCTLLEDETGNNILEYISLLHTELIGINSSLKNLKYIRKDMSRIADCTELFLKSKNVISK